MGQSRDMKQDRQQRAISKPIGHTIKTFTPVSKMNTLQILLSLVVHFDWEL